MPSTRFLYLPIAVITFVLGAGAAASAEIDCASVEARRGTTPAQVGLTQFESDNAEVNGTTLHYVRGGSGPAVILLHGFPQDWSEWRHVMSQLAKQFTVIAVDLRGIGGSRPTEAGYDAANLAADIQALARHLRLKRPYVAGHDIGGMVAYAYARAFPDETRGVMVLDVPLPGIEPWSQIEREPMLWHFHFHQTPHLPEALVAGRETIYFRDFVARMGGNPTLFSDADIARFTAAYGTPCSLRAGFEFYRAFPEIAKWNASRTAPTNVPIVLAAGQRATAQSMPATAADLGRKGARTSRQKSFRTADTTSPTSRRIRSSD